MVSPERGEAPPQPPRPRRPQDERAEARQWFGMLHVGFEFIVATLLFGGLGWYLDRRWDMAPWLMITGGALGFAVGMWLMVKAAMKMFHD
jgi:F0F1-type ATP synthase assembly protein I